MNWYIGQEIVGVRTSRDRVIKKDATYTIHGLRTCACNCGGVLIDVGILNRDAATNCFECNIQLTERTKIAWKHSSLFAPLADISELKEILETKTENA